MRASFAYGLKETVAAVLLSSFIAGGVCAMTSSGAAQNEQAIAVDRTNKGDRLPSAVQQQPSETIPAARKRTPLGCDPAFSPVVEPTLAHIYKRCMV
jgi:hypothetical protein